MSATPRVPRTPVLERALKKVVFDATGCWLWTASLTANGYAVIWSGGKLGRMCLAHRVMFDAFRGPIGDGLDIDHLCRVRNCVNPFHLESVTRSENLLRSPLMGGLNRAKTHCPRGHEYTGDNLYITTSGSRNCKECSRESLRQRRARNREMRGSQTQQQEMA